MADVTDAAFRRVIAARGKPDVMWTEFVSADGLVRATPEGKAKLMKDLIYVNEERPIVAQLFSAHPEYMREAAKLVRELGFDGIDINMGCPDRSIEKQGAGAALIKTPELAREVIKAAKEGARGDGVEIPVSVKTRVGYNSVTLDEWLPEILKESPAAVTIHARTRKEMSKVPANWDLVRQAVQIRDHLGSSALILGNGDVTDIADAREKAERTGADGIMLGRAIFGNPWLFNETHPKSAIPLKEQLEALREHVQLFDEILGGTKSFAIMKKHFKAYVEGFDGAKEIREALMNASNPQEVTSLLSAMIDGTADPR
ncbi:MAG TPA: tRNA-dihydrouridine synthase [Candidatus Paceibacterota bacterium]|nr:tRNA-dihydrouridine synthase [Candidatus Paceibacterota bacterium]